MQEALSLQKIFPKKWLPTYFVETGSRRRITISAKKQRGEVVLGYYYRRSKDLTPIHSCLVTMPTLLETVYELRPILKEFLASEKTIDIFCQQVGEDCEVVITGAFDHRNQLSPLIVNRLKKWAHEAKVFRLGFRQSLESKVVVLLQKKKAFSQFGLLKVELPPLAFLQPTLQGEKVLTDSVVKFLPSGGKFADLFSGCGTFSGGMLEKGVVDAYESVPSAVAALKASSKKFPLQVFQRDLFRHPLRAKELNQYDAVVFDPPRAGCETQAFEMAKSKVPVLIAVSCNPATFVRDAKILSRGGYEMAQIQLVDQFVWSHHVEMVAVFTKKERSKRHFE